MTWYVTLAVSIASAVALGFWGWVGHSIIAVHRTDVALGAKLHALEAAVGEEQRNRDIRCDQQRAWMGRMSDNIDQVLKDIGYIRGWLEKNGS